MGRHLSRREFVRTAACAAASAGLRVPGLAAIHRKASSMDRPNILLIMSDEHNANVTGCYGNGIVHTPNLERLSEEGVTFDNAYCNSPLCVPSRLSFTAGKYVSRVGAWSNNCWLPSGDTPSLPRIMNAAGYESLLCGKMHYDRTRRYGFREIGGEFNRSLKSGKGGRRLPEDLTPKPGISPRFDQFHPGEDSQILSHDRAVTEGTVGFLRSRGKDDAPFFLLTGYLAPHFPLIVPEHYWEPYKGRVPMPEIPDGHLETLPLNYKHLRIAFNNEDVPEGIVRKGRELYYGLTHWMDDQIGEILRALDASELAENTVVVYTTDHGENLGEHGLWWKNAMYDHAARVPLIVSWPKRWGGGQRRKAVCSLVDLVRTIAELGGAEVPGDWDGDSMLGWLDDPGTQWKDFAVSEYYAHNIASGYAMIRMGGHKYVYHTPPNGNYPAERELYDLEADPGEFTNLARNGQHADRLEGLHAALVEELGEHPDETELRCLDDYARGYDR